jgi:hypothetical protein
LADHRIQSARQRAHELLDLGSAQRLPHPLVVDFLIRQTEGYVAPNVVIHQIDVLSDVSDIALPRGNVVVQVAAVNQDSSRGRNEQT